MQQQICRTALMTLLAALAAGATSITVQHSYEFPDGDASPKSWVLPKFDTNLGTLTSVEYYAGGSMWSDYSVVGAFGSGGFSVGVGGHFGLSAPGLSRVVTVPYRSTGSLFVARGGTVSGSIESSGEASGVLYSPAVFLPGAANRTMTVSIYQPENYGYGTVLVPDICWHGRVSFIVTYNFDAVPGSETPEPAPWLMLAVAAPLLIAGVRARRRSCKASTDTDGNADRQWKCL